MFSIDEAKATRQAATVNIPACASREFGKDTVERAIEEKAAAEQAETEKRHPGCPGPSLEQAERC